MTDSTAVPLPLAASWGPVPGNPARPGPVGSPRGVGVSILLAIVTLGIYTFVWTWKTQDEIKRYSGTGVGGPLGCLIYLVASPVTFFLLPNEVAQMLRRAGWPSRVETTTGFWYFLPLVGSIVWFVKVQEQLNDYWRAAAAVA